MGAVSIATWGSFSLKAAHRVLSDRSTKRQMLELTDGHKINFAVAFQAPHRRGHCLCECNRTIVHTAS
jgi:hypothetical protein